MKKTRAQKLKIAAGVIFTGSSFLILTLLNSESNGLRSDLQVAIPPQFAQP
jgi:hypothetical protein